MEDITFKELQNMLVSQTASAWDIENYSENIQTIYPAIGAHYLSRGLVWGTSFGEWLLDIQESIAQGDLVDILDADVYPTLMQIDQTLRNRFWNMERDGELLSKYERELIGDVYPDDRCSECDLKPKDTPAGYLDRSTGSPLLICQECAKIQLNS